MRRLRQTQLAVCLMYQYGGMAFVDFAHLKAENIKKGILGYKRQKTGTPMCLEVLSTTESMRKNVGKYLFPFLSGLKKGRTSNYFCRRCAWRTVAI